MLFEGGKIACALLAIFARLGHTSNLTLLAPKLLLKQPLTQMFTFFFQPLFETDMKNVSAYYVFVYNGDLDWNETVL